MNKFVVWCMIPGFNYQVSNEGDVRNATTLKVLRKYDGKTGHYVILNKESTKHRFGIRYLVAKYFVPNEKHGTCVKPIDGNYYNAKASNLYWTD